jgi:ribosomal protein S18 acetylase RimI-like enzyme
VTGDRTDLVRRIEEAGFVTWPAFERTRYDGWELRATMGVTRRANSVSPVAPSQLPLREKIAFVESWFTERGQPAVFRLTELADSELDGLLDTRGFIRSPDTHTLILREPKKVTSHGVDVVGEMTKEWFAAFCSLVGRDRSSARHLELLIRSIPGEKAFASVVHRSRTIGVGLGVVYDDMLGVYNMNTDAERRRRGVASAILDAILNHGSCHDARLAFLQVNDGNRAARQLYAKAGFTSLYPYWYREPAASLSR